MSVIIFQHIDKKDLFVITVWARIILNSIVKEEKIYVRESSVHIEPTQHNKKVREQKDVL